MGPPWENAQEKSILKSLWVLHGTCFHGDEKNKNYLATNLGSLGQAETS